MLNSLLVLTTVARVLELHVSYIGFRITDGKNSRQTYDTIRCNSSLNERIRNFQHFGISFRPITLEYLIQAQASHSLLCAGELDSQSQI